MARKVVALTTEQKCEIYNFKKKSPQTSFRQLSKMFTCKFDVQQISHQREGDCGVSTSYVNVPVNPEIGDSDIELELLGDREIELEIETSRGALRDFTLLN